MSRTLHDSDEFRDALALYAMDLLDGESAAQVEAHLAEGCSYCTQQLRELRAAFASVARAAQFVDPPAELRARIVAIGKEVPEGASPADIQPNVGTPDSAAGPQVWKAWDAASAMDFYVVRSNDQEWQQVHAGIWAKRLHVDRERDLVTMLVRMAAGASYLPHRHGGPEQCFVIEGDLREGDLITRAGDFQYAAAGSKHGAQSTESGCLLLIVSSLRDELLPGL